MKQMDIVERLNAELVIEYAVPVPVHETLQRAADERAEAADLIESLQKKVVELEEALQFYRDEWKKAEHPFGLAGPDMTPTHKLVCDYGERARATLQGEGQ